MVDIFGNTFRALSELDHIIASNKDCSIVIPRSLYSQLREDQKMEAKAANIEIKILEDEIEKKNKWEGASFYVKDTRTRKS